jgi:tRNA 2-thiouridine synthesizing protein A
VTRPDATVEARGVLCPVPIIRLARAASTLPVGSLVELLTDDPAAQFDVPAWCRLRGHVLELTEPLAAEAPEAPAAGPTGPEPHTPNDDPGQALRHLIRLGSPSPSPSTGSAGRQASAAGSARR